jgi:NTE family protein
VLSGGSLRTLGYLGAFEVLEQHRLLVHLKEIVAVSAGGFFAFCKMLGYTTKELTDAAIELDFSILTNIHPEGALSYFETFGIDTGENLKRFLQSFLRIKNYSPTLTFAEWATLHPTGIQLRIVASDLHTIEPKEFSLAKTPTVPIVDALRASMSLPLFFMPVADPHTGHLLVDGGVLSNFPMNLLTEKEQEESIGISFEYLTSKVDEIPDFLAFLRQIYVVLTVPRTYATQKEHKDRCILIQSGEYKAWNFELSKEDKERMIQDGRDAALQYIKQHTTLGVAKHKPLRRYSVG